MDTRMIFRGYRCHNLDQAEEMFTLKFQREPNFFALRPNWQYSGNDKNIGKVVASNLAGYAAIYIPLSLTMHEFVAIESELAERRSTSQSFYQDETIERLPLEAYEAENRFCSYCGRMFVGLDMLVIHCGSEECQRRHKQYLEYISDLKIERDLNYPDRKRDTPEFSLDNPRKGQTMGWVYFIQAENGLVKIGKSDNIKKRFALLTAMSPVDLRLRHAVAASNYGVAESWFHERFKTKRDHGEWFSLSESDLEWTQGLNDYSLDQFLEAQNG